ncbi:MAG: hypothetical protein LC734_03560 [Acidobacteria bacterium]|nr:hypothetical protein [Acidobacteriota bacterium]
MPENFFPNTALEDFTQSSQSTQRKKGEKWTNE